MKYLYLMPLLLACGGPDTSPSFNLKAALQIELARVEPLLHICHNMPAKAGTNHLSKEINCELGDGMTDAGFASLYGSFNFSEGILNSISANGRPWRNPVYFEIDKDNSFSRDQLLGLIEWTIATRNKEPLQRVMKYVQETGKLCPDANDNKCDMTQSIKILVELALGGNPNVGEDILDITTISAEATGSDGYQAFLVARKIMIHKTLGRKGYDEAANTLYKRFPHNAFFALVAGDSQKAAELTLVCLRAFNEPGSVVASHYASCPSKHFGYDVVSVGRWLVKESQ